MSLVSDIDELTDIRTLIDIKTDYSDEEDRTAISSPYKSYTYTFSDSGDDGSESRSDSSSYANHRYDKDRRPESHSISARFENIYFDVSESESSSTERRGEYAEGSSEAETVSERSSLISKTESELSYTESWDDERLQSLISESEDEEKLEVTRNEFIASKLQCLRDEYLGKQEQVVSDRTRNLTSDEKKFFKKRLRRLKSSQDTQPKLTVTVPKTHHYDVDMGLINKLKLKNLMEKMKKATLQKDHDIHSCKVCHTAKEYGAMRNFVKTKTLLAESKSMDVKIENHIAKHNSVSLIGRLACDLPKQREDPALTWQKLMQGLS
ncbi:uncharacterized protein LOC144356732 [Saccoglossus kowalevskii]